MAAKDKFHDHVKNALVNDGWTITHEQLSIKWGKKPLLVDFGAERLLVAQKERVRLPLKSKANPNTVELVESSRRATSQDEWMQRATVEKWIFINIKSEKWK